MRQREKTGADMENMESEESAAKREKETRDFLLQLQNLSDSCKEIQYYVQCGLY